MIVIIGCPGYRAPEGNSPDAAVGIASEIARRIAAAGARVELVGKVGDDAAGDALVLALAREGVGHAALLRDPAHGTPLSARGSFQTERAGDDEDSGEAIMVGVDDELATDDGLLPADLSRRPALDAGDLSLALRYLTDYTVVVVADTLDVRTAQVVREAATFADAQLVVLVRDPGDLPESFASATAFEAPGVDPDGAFAAVVARYSVALDAGKEPGEAFGAAVSSAGWQAVEG